jgi:hypothetical protein
VWLTNLSNGNRSFTWPNIDGTILVNIGAAYDNPTQYFDSNSAYPTAGQLLIHELSHAWQIAHTWFPVGLACDRIAHATYSYGPPGPPFSSHTVEGQASMADQWFAGLTPGAVSPAKQMDLNNAYFGYIQNNIRTGAG